MYILKNAIRNILRSKGRNVLIGIIVLVVAASSCVALSIKKSALKAEEEGLKGLVITGEISQDRQSIMKKAEQDGTDLREAMKNYPKLTLEQMQKYATSDSVKNFYYTLSSSINSSGELEAVSTSQKSSSSSDSSTRDIKMKVPDGMGSQGDFTIKGYSSKETMTSFIKGESKLKSGEMFSEDTNDMKCIISDELATLNSLEVGSKITLANPNVEDEVYELTVSGIYSNSESTTDMKFSTSSDPANQILTSYNTLNNITTLSAKNATTETNEETGETSTTALRTSVAGTYVFSDVSSLEKFKQDVKIMGLPEYYSVASSDLNSYEQSLVPIKNLSKFADVFLVVVLIVGGVILAVLNIFNIRERKYEVGVLTAIGMKKWKVASQYIIEIFIVTFLAIAIGSGIGSAISVPTANTLLQSQITSQQTQKANTESNFGRSSDRTPMGNTSIGNAPSSGGNRSRVVNYIDEINASTDVTVIGQLLGIGVLLTVLSSSVGVIFILRYEPLRILANRT